MDAAQQARVNELTDALRKRGDDALIGSARHAAVDELNGLLGAGPETGPETKPTPLAPEKQVRADEIKRRLMDNARGKPGGYLDAVERNRLARELSDILSETAPGDSGAGGGDTAA